MSVNYFDVHQQPIPRRGFTPVEAVEFVKREFSKEKNWLCWTPGYVAARLLGKIVGKGNKTKGKIGPWSWSRIPCSYPVFNVWYGYDTDTSASDDWVGALKIRNESGEEFLVFSFFNAAGAMGQWYVVSTCDVQLLDSFARAVQVHFHPPDQLIIQVQGGPDINLDPADDEEIFLPETLSTDIERQTYSFFENAERYRQLRLRHQRGFLLVGCPGNGKSMMLRHLVRQCHRRYHVSTFMLRIFKNTEDADVAMVFRDAAQQAPSILLLEDLDSLSSESQVSRAHLLAQLDGLETRDGLLVVGTTNHPEAIDTALLHRPSRFDRIWKFPLPDVPMRLRYLKWAFPTLHDEFIAMVAEQTNNWSYAFLNELRTSAVIRALEHNPTVVSEDDVREALVLLQEQFQAGRKNHIVETSSHVGFGPGER